MWCVDSKGNTFFLICENWLIWEKLFKKNQLHLKKRLINMDFILILCKNTLPKLIEICSQNSKFECVRILELNSDTFFSQWSFPPPSITAHPMEVRMRLGDWFLFSQASRRVHAICSWCQVARTAGQLPVLKSIILLRLPWDSHLSCLYHSRWTEVTQLTFKSPRILLSKSHV